MAVHHGFRRGTVRGRAPAVVVGPLLTPLTLGAATGCRRAAARLEYFPAPVAPGRPAPPFSHAVRAGGLLALAGQLGTDGAGRLVPGGVEAETRQALENVRAALARAGASMDDVVTCTVLLADVADRDRMSRVYVTYFRAGRLPARTAFGTGGSARRAEGPPFPHLQEQRRRLNRATQSP